MDIRKMHDTDWEQVARIYREGIATGIATFETQVPDYPTWDVAHIDTCRLVALEDSSLLGWAALSPVSGRCVYGGVAEVSIYIAKDARGKGVGWRLLNALVHASEKEGFWTLQSGIFPTNTASIKLHEKAGFRFLGKRERVAQTPDGTWTDNLIYERRSKIVGI